MPDSLFRKSQRLLKSVDFDRVFAGGKSRADRTLVVYALRNESLLAESVAVEGMAGRSTGNRLGLVVSRKCGNAVRRNRWKRLLREAFRTHSSRLSSGVDLVVIPRPQATPTLASVSRSLVGLSDQLHKQLIRSAPPAVPPSTEERLSPSPESPRA